MRKFKIFKFDNKTLSWWYSRKSKIDMNPPYQRRGRLWSQTDKAFLIDSIINGYDIPKLYIADYTWGESKLNLKNLPYAIIDGKQRFEAIFDFFEGKLTINENFVYVDNPNLKLGGLGLKDLIDMYSEVADEFLNYNLMVMGVYTETESPINELFIRLNRSKPLTGAEIRNAVSGPIPELIRQIGGHDFFTTNIRFAIDRMQDYNAAAKLLIFEYYQDFKDTKKNNLDKFVEEVSDKKYDRLELAYRHVLDTLSIMSSLFLPNDMILTSSGVIPVYYWFIRSLQDNEYPYLREFIYQFEKNRKLNRKLIREDPTNPNIDPIYVEYDNYNRSTNNQQSHQRRYEILREIYEMSDII